MARWKRFFLFGCLSLFILSLVVVGVGYYQMTKKVPIRMDRQIAHPDATIYARFYVEDGDTEMAQFAESMISNFMMAFVNQGQQKVEISKYEIEEMKQNLKRLLPAIFEINRFEDETFSVRMTASGFGNLQFMSWKFILSVTADEQKERYKDYTLIGAEGMDVITYADGDFVFADNADTMKKTLDQFQQPDTLIENSPLAGVNQDSPFFGFAKTPILLVMVEPTAEEMSAMGELERTAWSTEIIDGTSAVMTVLVDVPQSPIVQSYLEKFVETPENAWRGTVDTREGGYQLNIHIDDVSALSKHLGKALANHSNATEEQNYE